ncbi:MAG: DMT family transporter [Desulfobacteraceae bacterium]|nr:MAG: DMT family transporter [Desulfobacteraceae bacterium]
MERDKALDTSRPQHSWLKTTKKLFDAPYFLLPLAPLFWSGNFILGRFVRSTLPPIGLAFWRWLVASLLIIAFAWPYLKKDCELILKNWKIIFLLAILGVATFNALAYLGLRYTTAINGVLMQSVIPVIIVIMTFLFFRETIRKIQALGICLSLSGVFVIVTQGVPATFLSLSFNIGDLMILIAVICYAAYSALLQKRPPIHQLSFLVVTFVIGTVILLPFYLWEHFTIQAMPFNRNAVLSIAYVAVFPSILAYFCFNRGVELIGANKAGLFIHLMPVFGSIMAVFFLGERFRVFHALGIFLILTGIGLATRKKTNQKGAKP